VTTIVVVKKKDRIAIGADTLVTFGETRLPGDYEANDKIIRVGDSYIGLAGSTAHFEVLRRVLGEMEQPEAALAPRGLRDLPARPPGAQGAVLPEPKEEDDDPYESSQITALIANPSGIYGVYSYREVFSFERFWAIGSGRNFALGAMYASYGNAPQRQAGRTDRRGRRREFDKSSAGPCRVHDFEIAPA
jgi:ATP-dependent HslUV protease, peptidase subunit HslV